MCGIFGMVLQDKKLNSCDSLEQDLKLLFLLSEVRGQDSSGMALLSNHEIKIFRRVAKPSVFLTLPAFTNTLKSAHSEQNNSVETESSLIIIGQCRLVTNGSCAIHENNQPIRSGHFVGIHNGIILNAEKLANTGLAIRDNAKINSIITAESGLVQSDTGLFLSRLESIYHETRNFIGSVSKLFREIEGSASVALMCDSERKLVIASNTGSLYYLEDSKTGNFVFASERVILMDFLKKSSIFNSSSISNISQVKAGYGVEIGDTVVKKFNLNDRSEYLQSKQVIEENSFPIHEVRSDISNLKRCTKCVLPNTYPFISFDEAGVCNFCKSYERQKFKGVEELEKLLKRYRSKDGKPDCLVGLSGGRDSCYGLHVLKTRFLMHPIAYTYDWGLTTDASRRNQAKICGKLGVEHIIRAPDIQKKRRHIKKNIYAWLERPKLGMVPLFMAGDKDFYHYGRQLRKGLDINLTVFCSGQLFEQREFFVGFCGVKENVTTTARLYNYSNFAKLRLAFWYISQYLLNPRYLNESFFDSVRSYFTSFVYKDDFLYLYEYLPWNEKEIELTLKKEYGWEDYKAYGSNQWRMGDGQTAFTNYIFYTIAGFTEFDNFRARQVREGLLTRDEALKLIKMDNNPKHEILQYFSYLIGFNLDEVLARIDLLPKLY